MKVLIIGAGGRESCLGWKLRQNSQIPKLYFSPGNGGTTEIGENISVETDSELINFIEEHNIDFTIVGPEASLIDGIVDKFHQHKLKIFGPTKEGAKLEGEKAFAKDFMKRFNIPTADYESFDDFHSAVRFIEGHPSPLVIKASGPAAGKGSIKCLTKEDAIKTVENMMLKKVFGKAGEVIVIEEFLEGEESSIIGLISGNSYRLFLPSQDHKQIFDGDKGPNTGGMGAYAPVPLINFELRQEAEIKVFKRTIAGLLKEGLDFRGVLYAGIMVTKKGIKVLEFNVRFGDPETQAILPIMKSDLLPLLLSVSEGNEIPEILWEEKYALCVVLASKGYPGHYEKGKLISFKKKPSLIFHAGTKKENGKFYTNGGRVLNIVGRGKTLIEAKEMAYREIENVHFDGMYFRTDIGDKGIKRL